MTVPPPSISTDSAVISPLSNGTRRRGVAGLRTEPHPGPDLQAGPLEDVPAGVAEPQHEHVGQEPAVVDPGVGQQDRHVAAQRPALDLDEEVVGELLVSHGCSR